ncbi:MAG: hypothetical protein HY652_15485 [Acidobacteria bacterium]|nr:hypothetical protein [Acidobacteriota bacterium]
MRSRGWIGALLILAVPGVGGAGVPPGQTAAAVHVHSRYSNGSHTLAELAELARRKDIPVVVVTDSALTRIRYGLPPFRKIFGRGVHRPGVLDAGVETYFREARELSERTGVRLIPGVEVVPFYYWSGSPWAGNLEVHKFNRHLLVLGLSSPEAYQRIPAIENPRGGTYGLRSAFLLWPGLLVLAGAWLLRPRWRIVRMKFFQGRRRVRHWKVGAPLVLAGVLGLVNNYPFRYYPWDAYDEDAGIAPYQYVIDWVNDAGGLIFWSYPEAKYPPVRSHGATVLSPPHPEDLLSSRDYTGMEVIYGDIRGVLLPGRQWDQLLEEFGRGKRARPPWGLGSLDFHEERPGNPWSQLDSVLTVLLTEDRSEEGVLGALRAGRAYAVWQGHPSKLWLASFTVNDRRGLSLNQGESGELASPVRVHFRLVTDGSTESLEVRLIRSGNVVSSWGTSGPGGNFALEEELPRGRYYYRLLVEGKYHQMASNPIFVHVK